MFLASGTRTNSVDEELLEESHDIRDHIWRPIRAGSLTGNLWPCTFYFWSFGSTSEFLHFQKCLENPKTGMSELASSG